MKINLLAVGTIVLLLAGAGCESPAGTQGGRIRASELSPGQPGVGSLNAELWSAAERGESRTLRTLCDRGAQVNAADPAGNSALMFASQGGHVDAVRVLLMKGAQPNMRSGIGATALMYGSQYGYDRVVQALLDAGADVNLCHQKGGSSPLMMASLRGHSGVVELLLRHDADVNARNDEGRTALMLAAGSGHTAIVEMLVSGGAKILMEDKRGKTAIDYAADGHFIDIVDRLRGPAGRTERHRRDAEITTDRTADVEAIEDVARMKMFIAALGNRDNLGGWKLQDDGSIVGERPAWSNRVVNSMSSELEVLLRKYEVDLQTSTISSSGEFNLSSGSSSEGSYATWSMRMEEWSDIITVEPPGMLPAVKLKSGWLRLKLPSMEIVFEDGAVCTVDGRQYEFRDGRWGAAE